MKSEYGGSNEKWGEIIPLLEMLETNTHTNI